MAKLQTHVRWHKTLRETAKRCLLSFTQYTKPDYRVHWHHGVLADLIEADVEIHQRQLAVAAKAGLIRGASEADILDLVTVEAEPPLIKSENRLQEAQADQILLQAGVMSKESMAARHGLVYADERDKMEGDD